MKKGFTYLTGPTETSFTLTLRNNAPGGGGNDWALDDIAVATCSPEMTFTPSFTPTVCTGNTLDLTSTVASYFNNYTYYKWQSSTDNGATWVDESGVNSSGIGSPVLNSGQYYYTTPAHTTQPMNTGDNVQYRLVTATTLTNLATATCVLADTVNVVPEILNNCAPVLGTHIISFNANREGNKGILRWTVSKETELFTFVIEGSADGKNFSSLGTMHSSGLNGSDLNGYTWSEEYRQGKYYYRIKMYGTNTGTRYSRVVAVDGLAKKVNLLSIINPFNSQLTAYVDAPEAGIARIQLVNNMGIVVKSQNSSLQQGANQISISNTGTLPNGMYTLRIISNQTIIGKKVVKH